MKQWTVQCLKRFAAADDLRIAPFYSDGRTYGTLTWIWSVVVGQHLFVRAWNGQRSAWYQSAVSQRGGRIHLAGENFKVSLSPVAADARLTGEIDDAYRQKYQDSAYLLPMLQAGPQSATIEILPV